MADYWVKSGTGGTDAGTSWANAAESLSGLMTAQAIAGGDTIYVHNTHSALYGASTTLTLPEATAGLLRILCVDGGDATGTALVDGTVGSLTTGAVEGTSGNFSLTINTTANCDLFVYGMTFRPGAGAASAAADINVFQSQSACAKFVNCIFWNNSTNASALTTFGTSSTTALRRLILDNCAFRAGSSSHTIDMRCNALLRGCYIHASSSTYTSLFKSFSATDPTIVCVGCDFTKATNVYDISAAGEAANFKAYNCVIGTPTTGTHTGPTGPVVEFQACGPVDAGNGPDLLNYYYQDAYGVVEDSQTVYITTGAAQGKQDDGTLTSYSLKMDPTTYCSVAMPLYTPWIHTYVGATGSKTVSIKCADTEAAVLKDHELWMEVEFVGGAQVANSPETTCEITAPIVTGQIDRNFISAGSNLTDTGEAWDGIVETGTYTLSKTITIDEYGYIRCRVGLGKNVTNQVYVNPKITVA